MHRDYRFCDISSPYDSIRIPQKYEKFVKWQNIQMNVVLGNKLILVYSLVLYAAITWRAKLASEKLILYLVCRLSWLWRKITEMAKNCST